jgi:hypothetical protein
MSTNERRHEPLLRGRTYQEAVEENLADLIAQHNRGEIDWRGADPQKIAGFLDWATSHGDGRNFIAEAFWRYYEWANPS